MSCTVLSKVDQLTHDAMKTGVFHFGRFVWGQGRRETVLVYLKYKKMHVGVAGNFGDV